MQKYIDTIQDRSGNAIQGANVYVRKVGGALATIYSDNGVTQKNNPLLSDAVGTFSFYAEDGRYTLEVFYKGQRFGERSDILLEDPADESPANIKGGTIKNSSLEGVHLDAESKGADNQPLPTKSYVDASVSEVLNYDGLIEAEAEWSDVPGHSDPAFDVQAQTLADRTKFLLDRVEKRLKNFVDVSELPWVLKESDTPNEVYTKIQSALNHVQSLGGGTVALPSGVFVTGGEIRIPSNCELKGSGRFATTLIADSGLQRYFNVVTNLGNTNLPHSEQDVDIKINNLTVDGNCENRTSGSTNNNGCSIKLAAVKHFEIRNVEAINGPLHGIDIAASVYWNDGDILSQPPGPSLFGLIESCCTRNPWSDDGITTHNSGFITVRDCQAIFDASTRAPGSTQQGFEADEGSYDILFENCLSSGFTKAFQAKGHATTRAAESVTFRKCIAEYCAFGFDIQTGNNPPSHNPALTAGKGTLIDNCIVRHLRPRTGYTNQRIINFSGYLSLTIRGLRCIDFGEGTICQDVAAGMLDIDGLTFETASTRSGGSRGLVHVFTSTPRSLLLKVSNLVSLVPQPIPAIRVSATGIILKAHNIHCDTSDPEVSLIWKFAQVGDEYTGLSGSREVWIGNSDGRVNGGGLVYQLNHYTVSGTSDPNSYVFSPVGSEYINSSTGERYRKSSGNWTNTGWVKVSAA